MISNFLKIGKAIVSNWYLNLDKEICRECFEVFRIKINITWILAVAKRLYSKIIETYREEKIRNRWKEFVITLQVYTSKKFKKK